MSYKSREKKRRAKAATLAQQQNRAAHADRWYLTIVKRPCCCNDPSCARHLREGAECVFRYKPREILCVECAARRRIRYRTSMAWEAKARQKRRRSSGSPGRDSTAEDARFARELLERVRRQ